MGRLLTATILCILAIFAQGCSAPQETAPAYLTIAQGAYESAFNAVNEVARTYGMIPALRDRRAGVIETQPAIAGSLLEPWDRGTRTIERAADNTLSFQRRRARFEFQPVRTLTRDDSQDGVRDDALTGPDILAQDRTSLDLTAIHDEIELRVWVYNEKAHVPGIRRSAWSRRMTSRTQVIDPETGEAHPSSWTVVSRDRDLEAHLLVEVARQMGAINAAHVAATTDDSVD